MVRFGRLPGAEVGDGPEDADAARRLDDWLQTVPGVNADDDYAYFLHAYSGAYLQDESADQIVDLFGFSGVSSVIDDMIEPVEPGQTHVAVAQCIYHQTDDKGGPQGAEYTFGLSTDPADRTVYAHLVTMDRLDSPWRPWAPSFVAWLADVVERGGWLDFRADLEAWVTGPPGSPSET
jgi:hypothetical protein